MEILISVATKIAEYTLEPIGRQVGYLIFYKGNFKELEDQMKELEGVKEHVTHSIEAERRNGKVIEGDVQNWVDQVDKIIKEAKQLSEDPHRANVGCSRWSFPDLWSRHQLSRKAKKMGIDVVELQEKGKFAEVGYLPPLDLLSNYSAPRGNEKLESRKKMKEDIVLALKDSKLSKIGVYGLGGVGKSTLVKEVAKQVKDDKLFDEVVIANVSKTPDLDRIQGEIADQLGLHFEVTTSLGRAARLHERIRKGKNVLIILDDIWTRLDLEGLGIPLEGATLDMKGHENSSKDNHRGCTLLLTSRSQGILQEMEIQKEFRLEVLNEKETWDLFDVMVGGTTNNASLRNIASQVAKKFAGLPVVIVTMARALRNKDMYYWKDALNKLERVGNKEMDDIIYSALEFCYNGLEGDDVKELFLLCGLHGKSPFISDLLRYGIGLGLFKDTYTVDGARSRLYKMISDLKASCLLLEDDTDFRVKMHDTVCEVAISIASRDHHVLATKRNNQLDGWPSDFIFKNCTQIVLDNCGIKELPEKLDCPNLKLLHISSHDNHSLNLPLTFFEGMGNLEVLDLTGMIISLLPTSLASLTKLKTLCLDQCDLGDMGAIGVLKNLEILSFLHSSMTRLPVEIGQLINLRMLDLTSCGVEVFPPNILSKLTNLEELYMGDSVIKWGVENSSIQNENATLVELIHLTKLTSLEIQLQEDWILPRELLFEKIQRFKIVIGDKWEWSDRYGASRLLKLKLRTNIHLEHGIKTLIQKTEDLYLDEIRGVSNVLYQLSGDGFSELKNLHIQNNANLHYVIDSKERNQSFAFFPNLVTLILQNLNNLEKICHGPLTAKSFGKLSVIKVKSCSQLEYLFLATMVKELPQLLEIEVTECNSMKNIVHMDCSNGGKAIDKIEFIHLHSLTLQHLSKMDSFCTDDSTSSCETLRTNTPTSFFNMQVAVLNLVTLKLCSMNLNRVWDDDNISMANSFQNLTNLIIEDCGGLKYLFSSFMVKSLKNLIMLEVSKCHMMEGIIAAEGRNNEIVLNEDRFLKLEKIKINDMKNLKAVWQFQFEGLKTLEVNKCEKLETIFPCGHMMVKEFASLETLKVTDCASVEEIFQFDGNGTHRDDHTMQLKNLILLGLPKMKQIWSRDPRGIVRFSNLQSIEIKDCPNLQYLFPFSIAKDLSLLQDLSVFSCGIKEVVSSKDAPMEGTPMFELNHLASLQLVHLSKLKGFYGGPHSLECQSLKNLNVFNCEQLMVFKTHLNRSSSTDQLHFSMSQPLLLVQKVVGNLEELTLTCGDADNILQHQLPLSKLQKLWVCKFEEDGAAFPHLILQCTPNLKWLIVEWSSFKEIFCDETIRDKERLNQFSPKLEKLTLYELPELQRICEEGSTMHPLLRFLEFLIVDNCPILRNLVPSSMTFCFLTYMKIEKCNNMINLITPATATSLVKLETMIVEGCKSLEEIVTEDRVDAEITGEMMAFSSLQILELENLERLNCFSSSKCFLKFPLLEKVAVRQCPRMKIFSTSETSTPKLEKVLIDENDKEWCWEGDLNRTINKIFLDMVAFRSFKDLELSKYPELKELWYKSVGPKQFCNLASLVVQRCNWLSNFLISLNMLQALSNLKEIEVRDCDSLEAVFNLEGTNESAMVKGTIQLKKLTLSNLVKLKYIWEQDTQGFVNYDDEGKQQEAVLSTEKAHFSNLEVVRIEDCPNLEYLFPFFMAKDLPMLQDLSVNKCGIKEVVSKRDGHIEGTPIFELNHFASLELKNLHKLKGFYAGPHSLECQSLKRLHVFNCKQLKIFETQSNWPQVVGNLEELTVTCGDADIILQHQLPLSKLQSLWVSKFEEDGPAFPHSFLQCTPNLKTLVVQWSSFKEIFCDETVIDKERLNQFSPKLEKLTLHGLSKLQLICEEGSPIHPLLQFLQVLSVKKCSTLINLVPSSVTFCFLTYMEIENCNNMINLISPSTATSLVKLKTMKVKSCDSLEEIVVTEDQVDAETKGEMIAFSSLQILELENLERLNCFSSSNCFFKFPLLEKVAVRQCPRMNIFSASETSTPKLNKVLVDEKNEESRWEGDLNGTIKSMFLDKVGFHSLKHLELSKYPELKGLWYGVNGPKQFYCLRSLIVQGCDWLSNFLISFNMLQSLSNLEELKVRDCGSLEVVFDLEGTSERARMGTITSQLKKVTLSNLVKLKHVWKQDIQEMVSFGDEGQPEVVFSTEKACFSYMESVRIEYSPNLEYVFPFSIAKDLLMIQDLSIISCGIKEIVSRKDGSMDGTPIFQLNHLATLELVHLRKLKKFYGGAHSLECQSLKKLNVFNCKQLKVFETQANMSQGSSSTEQNGFPRKLPLFTIEKVVGNLEELTLNCEDVNIILQHQVPIWKLQVLRITEFEDYTRKFPYLLLQKIPNLKRLIVEWSSFKEVFCDETVRGNKEGLNQKLQKFELYNLPELQNICEEGYPIHPLLQFLELLIVKSCSSLRNLVPSSVTFYFLTYMKIENCNNMINLITPSTATSLVRLETMILKSCDSLEEIVIEDQVDAETKGEMIAFSSLQILEMENLERLNCFSSSKCFLKFPLLEKVSVRQCPRMNIFSASETSTPKLNKVLTNQNDKEWCWVGDLNGTINKMFLDKVAFCNKKHLKLSEYPELKDLWHGPVEEKIFCNLKILVVHKCDFLSNVLLSSNLLQALHSLEELEVTDCDSIEVVFDEKTMDDKDLHVKETSQLKKITLSGLSNLKHIWSNDPSKIISFKKLQVVKAVECQNLIHMFSLSLCNDLWHLEVLDIDSCGVEEIVAIEEGLEEPRFDFPHLNKLRLVKLRKLNSFYPKRHTLECPSLKTLNVYLCEALQIFSFDKVVEVEFSSQQALFNVQKISSKLEELSLNELVARGILDGCYEKIPFNSIELLRLQYFQETSIMVLNDILERFIGTTTLQVRRSSFTTLFLSEEISHRITKSCPKLKKLWLYQLDQLKHIWNEGCGSDPFLQNLEYLSVSECCSLIRLAPPSISFSNLTFLRVKDCKGMIYLMTSSIAKSLVHLTDFRIDNCEMIEEVVRIDEGEVEEEITFESLMHLKLISLSSLKSFCSGKHTFIFPSLISLEVRGCHKMQNFSSGATVAPVLTEVQVENGKKRWKEDLNTTIKQLFMGKGTSVCES